MVQLDLSVTAASSEETTAYAAVLSARGVLTRQSGSTLTITPVHRRDGGVAVLRGFVRWALDAHLTVRVSLSHGSDCSGNDARDLTPTEHTDICRQYHPGMSILARSMFCGAELADALQETRARLVDIARETGEDMGYGGVNMDSPTVQVAGQVKFNIEKLLSRLATAESQVASLTQELASADQVSTKLRELQWAVRKAWMPRRERAKLVKLVPEVK